MDPKNIIKTIYKKHKFKRYIEMIVGILISAIAFNLFILPNKIVFGGVTGISIIMTKFNIDPALFILFVSLFLLGISFIVLDFKKTKYSILGSILLPVAIKLTSFIEPILNLDLNDQLLFAIFGGALFGFGFGLVLKAGFTTGGLDIIHQIINKYFKISIGNSMLITDGLIALIGAFFFGWTKFMYSILIVYLISIIADKVLFGISDKKAFYIITRKKKKISDFVINELGHSITILDATGGYSNDKNYVLFTVIPTKEYFKLKEGIHEIDDKAFFTVIDAYEVYGGE